MMKTAETQATMATSPFETVYELDAVCGGGGKGSGGDPQKCFDDVWPWAVSGFFTGGPGAALAEGAAALLTSDSCGDGTNSPATIARNNLPGAPSTTVYGQSSLTGRGRVTTRPQAV